MRARYYTILLTILLITAFPVVGAWYLYHYASVVGGQTNRGQLISPPVPVASFGITNQLGAELGAADWGDKWWLVFVEPKQCDKACQDNLYKIRQIQTALGKNSDRVERMLVITRDTAQQPVDELLAHQYKGTELAWIDLQKYANAISSLSSQQQQAALSSGYLYVLDPQKHVMMAYQAQTDGRDVLKDLEHLLKLSHIG